MFRAGGFDLEVGGGPGLRRLAMRQSTVSDTARPSSRNSDSPWHLALAFGAVTFAAAAHSFRDVHDGTPWRQTMTPSAVMVLQAAVLTLGYRWLRNRNAGRAVMLVAGALICTLFGALSARLHSDLAISGFRASLLGISIGLGVGGLWALVFLLPAVIRDAKMRGLAADSMRREAELAQLRSSLQPHFLLNSLHAVAALVVDEPLVARRLLAALGDLLRDALESSPEIRPLEADVHWLRRYAEILEVRHSGLLRFEWDIAPETTGVLLPKLLLQPLLENAVKHGALCRDEGGVVILRTRFVDKALQLVVEDNGPGIPPGTKEGLGLRMVRERLSLAHAGATLRIESSPEGTRATIEIPRSREAG
jgi:signal transduction histidine kinase